MSTTVDLDGLLSHTGDGVCAVTTGGRIVLWNRAAERLLGHAARDVVGRMCCEVFVGRDAAGNRLCYQGCHVMALVQRGEPVRHFQMATRTKAGKPVWLDVSILVLPAAGRDASTTIHLFRDVTAAREIEALVRERLTRTAPSADNGDVPDAALTRRELEILRLIAGGANTRAIAERLHVSPATVRNHVQNLLGKLGVHSRLEAAAWATRHGLLAPDGVADPAGRSLVPVRVMSAPCCPTANRWSRVPSAGFARATPRGGLGGVFRHPPPRT